MVVDGGGSACAAPALVTCWPSRRRVNGWSGLLIYGCIRDVDEIMATDIGVQALGVHPMKTEKKGIGEIGVPVNFGGVTFRVGDYVYADNNGVIVAPRHLT